MSDLPVPSGRQLSHLLKPLLAKADRPMGAYELAMKLSAATGKHQFPNSIYRALHRLRDEGDVIELVSSNRWVWRGTQEQGPVLALICTACGACMPQSDPELAAGLKKIAAEQGFRVSRMHLEVEGRCSNCWGSTNSCHPVNGSH